jgi:hypothetical protein
VNTNKIKVEPLNYVNSDQPGVWGYAYAPAAAKTFTNDTTVTKVSLTPGAWATVDGVNLLQPLQ